METQSHKQLVAESESFKVWVELSEDKTVAHLHCNVERFTPRVLREGYCVFAEIERQAREANIQILTTFTPNPKFAKLFGGETVSTFQFENKTYEVIIWDLKQGPLHY